MLKSKIYRATVARDLVPRVVFVDSANRIAGTRHHPADALPGDLDELRPLPDRDLVRGDTVGRSTGQGADALR